MVRLPVSSFVSSCLTQAVSDPMPAHRNSRPHDHSHAFENYLPRVEEGLVLRSRRNMLKASLAGLAGLSVPGLLRTREAAAKAGQATNGKSVILLWMTGGPSHIDTWDPKPTRPSNNRGPFEAISTALPGVQICEHLPKQAAMLDKFTLIRSVDPAHSNHQPNQVFQTGNLNAAPRANPATGDKWPAIASICSKMGGANQPGLPPYVAFMRDPTHIGWGGYLGKSYDPFIANDATSLPVYDTVGNDTGRVSGADLFALPKGLSYDRIQSRNNLMQEFDRLRSDLDQSGSMRALDSYQQQAVDMLVGRRAQEAFDINREPEETRQRYGKHLWCQQALIARRLVEAGVSFVTLDLSYHPSSGTWDNHGDNGPYGGIKNGLGPLLPLFDHLITTLVGDLDERGLLDDVLVIAMGEFGRTPVTGTQDSVDGRNHWPVVMSMCLAGGGLRHGQVIGSSENDGGHIALRPVRPSDLAATIYRYMGVPLDATFNDNRGRPHPIVQETGQPIAELF